MSLFKQFGTDQKAEQDGVWVEYGPNEDGSIPAFKLSRMSRTNKKYTRALDRATKPHRRAIELETMSDEQSEAIFMRVFADAVLLDWRNVQDEGGVEIPFTDSNACQLFTKLPELYQDLQSKASKASLFRSESLEADLGNS